MPVLKPHSCCMLFINMALLTPHSSQFIKSSARRSTTEMPKRAPTTAAASHLISLLTCRRCPIPGPKAPKLLLSTHHIPLTSFDTCVSERDGDAGPQAPQLLHVLRVPCYLVGCCQACLPCLLGERLHSTV